MSLFNYEKQSPLANFAGKATQLSSDNINWILHSGVSDHMTCNESKLIDSQCSNSLQPIRLSNYSCMAVKKCSHSLLSPNFVLGNLLYIPSFTSNLIFISKLTKDVN